MKSKLQFLIMSFLFLGCNKSNCPGEKVELGEVRLSNYDKSILFDRYKPNQSIKFLRNKIDTIEFKLESQYNSSNLTKDFSSTPDCNSSTYIRLQNYGSYLTSKLKDTTFYIRLQALYKKNFIDITNDDTLSEFEFGFNIERTFIDIDKLYIDNNLIDNVLVNNKLYNNVLITSSGNYRYWRIKEVYFQQEVGIIKFTLFKNEFGDEAGDVFELIQ